MMDAYFGTGVYELRELRKEGRIQREQLIWRLKSFNQQRLDEIANPEPEERKLIYKALDIGLNLMEERVLKIPTESYQTEKARKIIAERFLAEQTNTHIQVEANSQTIGNRIESIGRKLLAIPQTEEMLKHQIAKELKERAA